jgi:hypothetical protein
MKLQQFSNGKVKFWGFGGGTEEMKSFLTPRNENDFDLLHAICQADIADPFDPFLEVTGDDPIAPFVFFSTPFMSPDSIAVANALDSIPRPKMVIDWEQLENTPEAVKFQITHKHWPCTGFNRAWEIGRFITRKNEVGLIKSLQTELIFENNDLRWPRGDSVWFQRNLGVDEGEVNVTWVLKIEGLPTGDIDPKAFRVMNIATPANWISEIPGVVHPEMDPWSEMLFLWGDDHAVHFRCPQSSLVSLWIFRHEDLTADGLEGFGGMLKGFTQVTESDRTYENMTRVY